MRRARGIWTVLAVCAGIVMIHSPAAAQKSEDEEKTLRFTIDGAFLWMGTWGNDIPVGETVSIDDRFDAETGTTVFDETVNGLFAEMRTKNVPWMQVGFEKGKWGISAEFWTLDTDGSAGTEADAFDAFRYHDVAALIEELDVQLQAANELSVWSARVTLLREVSKSLTIGVGLQTAKLDNRRVENLKLSEPFFSFFSFSGNVETRSKTVGTLIGPSFVLQGSGRLGGSVEVTFSAAQSVLFATLDNETIWQSAITFGADLFFPMDSLERLSFDSTTRAAIPVTDARALLKFDLGPHFSVGVFGLLSMWYDAPLALDFSQATDGWDPVRSTLVFASVGPALSVRF